MKVPQYSELVSAFVKKSLYSYRFDAYYQELLPQNTVNLEKKPLLVSINVQVIIQPEDRPVVGPEMDFESLPYFDQALNLDMNPGLPYLAEAIISQPFDDCDFLLKKGVHLNWDFPAFLKRSKIGATTPTEFPPVPTRWLITRYMGDTLEKQWIIESDALLQDQQGANFMDRAQTSLTVDIHSGKRPYSYLGRVNELQDWKERQGVCGDTYTNWKAAQGAPLTAMGWGSPSFDTFYPNCRGVFGFHDPEITSVDKPITYKVVGWYGEDGDDYWTYYLTKKEAQIKTVVDQLNELAQLDGEAKKAHATEAIEKLIADDLGIVLDSSPYISIAEGKITASLPAGGMVCFGEVSPTAEQQEPFPKTGAPLFAIGNTPTEALSALLVAEQFNDLEGLKREKLEDTFEAILMGDRLKSLKADIGPKFREFRHADEFYGSDGGISWSIQLVDDNPNKELHGDPHAKQIPLPTLPDAITPLLETLNKAQQLYDKTRHDLDSLRTELYADWYRYMHCAYPPPGETEEYVEVSEVKAMIENGSLTRFTDKKAKLGDELTYETEELGKATQSSLTYSDQVREAWQALKKSLAETNKKIADEANPPNTYHWEIHYDPAPRFWEPTPPAVVVAIPKAEATPKQAGVTSGLTGQFFAKPLNLDPAAFDVTELLKTVNPAPGLIPSGNLDLFKAEWEVEVFPAASMHSTTRSHGEFDPAFVLNNYFLGENEPDFDDDPSLTGTLAMVKTASIYTGLAYINQNLADRYRTLLQTYKDLQTANQQEQRIAFLDDVKKATEFLAAHDLLVLTLNGFNAALLQMHQSVQLNPADPLGFADYQDFAKKMAQALPSSKGFSPDPHAVFMPIRSGGLRLLKLRMVDTFGRFVEFTPDAISTPFAFTTPNHPDWVWLPPRLSQAARFNFRFLQSATQTADESQSPNATSPVCGWIVPNLLDQSLVFFQADGKKIGELNQNGDWKPTNAIEPSGYLAAVKNWLSKDKELLAALLEAIEEAIDNIHPNDREGQSAFSVLMGRPMAVVRLGVELELKGLPAVNMGWDEFRRDVVRNGRETDGFEQVKFPYRIGEYRQQNDGLIGYWSIEGSDQLSDDFSVNDSISASIVDTEIDETKMDDWLKLKNEAWKLQDDQGRTLIDYLKAGEANTIKKQDLIQPYFREGSLLWETLVAKEWLRPEIKYDKIAHYAEAGKLNIAPADQMQQFVCLMDPFGVVHLSSGIQPVKSIQLPEQFVKQALRNMEVSFLTAPVLGPEAAIELSLPNEQDYTWSWEEDNGWPTPGNGIPANGKTTLAEKDLAPFRTIANFPDRNVLREGKLMLRQKLEAAAEAGTQTK